MLLYLYYIIKIIKHILSIPDNKNQIKKCRKIKVEKKSFNRFIT